MLCKTKKEFAKSFEDALRKIGLAPYTRTQISDYYTNGFILYTMAHSFPFANWYLKLSLEDIKKIVCENDNTAKGFIRGFYESEGSNTICLDRKRGREYHSQKIRIYNFNKELLRVIDRVLRKLGFDFYLTNVALSTHRTHQVLRFIREINPCIKNQTIKHPPKEYEKWSKERILKELREFYDKKGFSPSGKDVGLSLFHTTIRHFGFWNEAKKVAGLEVFQYPMRHKTVLEAIP